MYLKLNECYNNKRLIVFNKFYYRKLHCGKHVNKKQNAINGNVIVPITNKKNLTILNICDLLLEIEPLKTTKYTKT